MLICINETDLMDVNSPLYHIQETAIKCNRFKPKMVVFFDVIASSYAQKLTRKINCLKV